MTNPIAYPPQSIPRPNRVVRFAPDPAFDDSFDTVPLLPIGTLTPVLHGPSPLREPPAFAAPRPAAPRQQPMMVDTQTATENPHDARWVAATMVSGTLSGFVVGIFATMFGPLWGAQSEAQSLKLSGPAGMVLGAAVAGVCVCVKRRRPSHVRLSGSEV